MTIVEFLEARIAEDEAAAMKAAKFRYNRPSDAPWERARMDIEKGVPSSSSALHALFDPARVLRECAAKRAIIEDYEQYVAERRRAMNGWDNAPASPIMKALAAVHSDHPDYQADWNIPA